MSPLLVDPFVGSYAVAISSGAIAVLRLAPAAPVPL